MWCEWAQLCIHQVWCLYNFRYKEAGRDQSCSKHSYYECFIEWRAASSLGAISSLDQLQWVRTTRTCSPALTTDHRRRGFLCQVSRLASDYTPPEFSSFSWPVNRWQLRNNRLVTNDGNNIKRETQAGRELSRVRPVFVKHGASPPYKPDPLEKLEPQETIRVLCYSAWILQLTRNKLKLFSPARSYL